MSPLTLHHHLPVPPVVTDQATPTHPTLVKFCLAGKESDVFVSNIGHQIYHAIQNPLPNSLKKKRLQTDALNLFLTYKEDLDKLVAFIKAMGVDVYDAKDTPWVKKVLDDHDVMAFTGSPLILEYPKIGLKQILKDREEWFSLEKKVEDVNHDLARAWLKCEKELRPFLLVDSRDKSYRQALLHEVFHLLQFLHGLPGSVSNVET